MRTNNNNLTQNYDSKLKTSSSSRFIVRVCVFCFLVLAFCLFSSLATAKIPQEQSYPTNLLTSHLAELLQDANILNVPLRVTELQPFWLTPKIDTSLWELSDIAPVNFAAQLGQNLPQNSFSMAKDPNGHQEPNRSKERLGPVSSYGPIQTTDRTHIERQLWQARISPPESEDNKKDEDELRQLIKQICSIEFKPRSETTEPIIVVEPAPKSEPNQASVDTGALEEPGEEVTPKLPYEPVSAQTLQMLRNLLQHPKQLNNPSELGEVLFLSGHLKEAAIAYKEALNRKSPDEPGSAENRAWILLQIGNCLRNDDLATAAKMYSQLITEHPDSPWSDLAKARYKLIDWYLNDKPRTLISENSASGSLIEKGVSRK